MMSSNDAGAASVAPDTLEQKRRAAVGMGLRSAGAGIICLVIGVWLHLDNNYLSIFTAHVANLQFAHTPFQKAVERVLGRLAGMFYCTLLIVFFRESPILCLALLAVSLLPIWYVQ